MLYLFMPRSLLKGLAHNGMSEMFIRWLIPTIDISEVFHRIVLWAGILWNLMIQVVPEPAARWKCHIPPLEEI